MFENKINSNFNNFNYWVIKQTYNFKGNNIYTENENTHTHIFEKEKQK